MAKVKEERAASVAGDGWYIEGLNVAVGSIMQWMVQQFRDLPEPWDAMGEYSQENYLERCEKQAKDIVRQVGALVSSHGHQVVPATIGPVTFNDGVKATLKIANGVQGAFEVAQCQGEVCHILLADIEELLESSQGLPAATPDQGALHLEDGLRDPLYCEAVAYVQRKEGDTISISNLQRYLRIGYNRVALLIEAMESAGVVAPLDGSGIRRVIIHVGPEPEETVLNEGDGDDKGLKPGKGGDEHDDKDPLYQDAVKFVVESGKTSISAVRSEMKVGYNRAANMLEVMEKEGVLSPPDNGGKRSIVVRQ